MAVIMGREGWIYTARGSGSAATSVIANIDTWSLSLTADPIETTAFGTTATSVYTRSFVPGLKSGTGSLSGNFEGGVHQDWLVNIMADTTVVTVDMVLYMNSSDYVSVTACITSVELGGSIDGKTTFSASYNTSGTVTKT